MARMRSRRSLGFQKYPVAASAITVGDLVMINSAGFAATAVAAASNKGVVGVATESVDNSGGSAGDLEIMVEEGIFTLTGSGFTQADVLTQAFASSGTAISGTQGTNEPAAGVIRRFRSSTSVDVEVSAFAGRAVS